MITGADLAKLKLEGPPQEAPPDPDDVRPGADAATEADENLPWPDPKKVEAWWAGERGRFADGVRHLGGQPVNRETCQEILRTGFQRQRRAAAYELALTSPSSPLYNWRALSRRQARSLSAA
jgi:uncharacterized protein (TIGR02270 family)